MRAGNIKGLGDPGVKGVVLKLAHPRRDIHGMGGQLEEDTFHAGITQAFVVARSHYDREINLEVMSQGFVPVYEDAELDEMEKAVTPLARNLANRLKETVLPLWK